MAILVTGIAGGLAQHVAGRLAAAGREVVGVDYRAVVDPRRSGTPDPALGGVTIYKARYDKTAIEDVFKRHTFEAVLHLGRVGNMNQNADARFDLNVVGSQKVMNLCLAHGVETLIVLSTFHIYGAQARNHTPLSEDDPPRAGYEFPEIADAIQLDNMASTWVYRHGDVRVVVLRPTNVVGPTLQNTMSRVLRLPRVPILMGFNPMMQFLHTSDLGGAILAALSGEARGVFNVAGGVALPWRTALELAGVRTFTVPSSLMKLSLRRFSAFPDYLVNFCKYPCVITGRRFRSTFDWAPAMSAREALASTVAPAKRASAEAAQQGAEPVR
jgi:UDP-glucose 4-epimerase